MKREKSQHMSNSSNGRSASHRETLFMCLGCACLRSSIFFSLIQQVKLLGRNIWNASLSLTFLIFRQTSVSRWPFTLFSADVW